jgi:ABC-type transport system involved in multi-copper enzyme maturation permease subunit
MFIVLLLVTFAIAVIVSSVVVRIFRQPVETILGQIVAEEIAGAWQRYLTFAIYVVGISGGVRLWDLEKYITPRPEGAEVIVLNADRWTFEVYRTVIGTLQSVAWLLLVFFIFGLIAYVIARGLETRRSTPPKEK